MGKQKSRKTLYLPDWLIKTLDEEGEVVGGPGEVAGAAILMFSRLPNRAKAVMLEQYHKMEVSASYGIKEDIRIDSEDPLIKLLNQKESTESFRDDVQARLKGPSENDNLLTHELSTKSISPEPDPKKAKHTKKNKKKDR